MTKRDVLAVALRILGLYLLVQALASCFVFFGFLTQKTHPAMPSGGLEMWVFGGYTLLMSVAGVVFMACANGIAASMVAEDHKLDWPEWLCDKAVLFDFGARIYGVVLLAQNVPFLVAEIVQRYQSTDNIPMSRSGPQSILSSAIMTVIGICLVAGIGRLATLIRNIVGAGKKTLEGPNA